MVGQHGCAGERSQRDYLYLILLYCVAHLPLVITTGQFHDGFCFEHGDARLTELVLWTDGRPLYGYYINWAFSFHNYFVPRFVCFVMYLAAALLLRNVLATIPVVDWEARFFIVSFVMVFPADSTRVSLPFGYYALSYLLFFVGFQLVSLYLSRRTLWLRLAALVAFFVSFGLPSLLVFYALVIVYIAYRHMEMLRTIKSALHLAWEFLDFLILPCAFWGVRTLYFPPSGAYAEYFNFGLSYLGLTSWASAISGAAMRPLLFSVWPVSWVQVVVVLGGGGLLYLGLRRRGTEAPESTLRQDLVLFTTGVIALLLALFPYLAVRKVPSYWDWNSRHSLLAPLGVSFVLVYGLRAAGRCLHVAPRQLLLVYCLLVAVFVTGNVRVYASYWMDWYKCLSLVQQFKGSEIMAKHTSFLFKDEVEQWNAKRRHLRFYEYAGLMKRAFGDERRFGQLEPNWHGATDLSNVVKLLKDGDISKKIPDYPKLYCLRDWEPEQPQYLVTIAAAREKLSGLELLRLKLLELFDNQRFQSELPPLVHLKYDIYSGAHERQ
jgi:hypothetical protein